MGLGNLIIAVILTNVFFSFFPFLKIDLSQGKVHSLSPASKEIIKNLDDVVTVKVYASENLPNNIRPLLKNLKTILEEFGRINRDKFIVEYFDPTKDQSAKSDADSYGIQQLQFSSLKSDKFEVSNGYFGLVLLYGSKKVVLPVAGDVGNMEYYIDSSIKRVLRNEMPEIALYEDSLQETELQYLRKYLEGNYKVTDVQLKNDLNLPERADSLVIVGLKDKLNGNNLTKIKEWTEKQKGLIAFLDRISLSKSLQGTAIEETGLEQIFKDKGMDLQTNLIVDESSTYANFQTQNGQFAVQYPLWLQIRPENINKSVPAVSGVNSLIMPWTSSLNLSGDAKELISSSHNSLVLNDFSGLSPTVEFPKQYTGKFTVGAINTNGVKLALIGNSNFIKDQYVAGNSQNLYLTLNMIDYFSQDPTLLSIRSKNLSNSPLINVNDNIKAILRWGNIVLPVFILIITAAIAHFIRKKNNKIWNYEN